MTWASFESALGGHRSASGALAALTMSCMPDLQAMLDRIGAGEAGPLLAAAQAAGSQERRSKLAAGLEIIDHHVPVDDRVTKQARFGRRRVSTSQLSPGIDMVLTALVASLIDSDLGGDAERLRARVAVAASGMERVLAADLHGLSKSDRVTEASAARRVLQRVLQLLLNDLQPRRTG